METGHFESRRNKILEFIIKTYVETAEPVGSVEVCRRFHLRVSPATVRHVMGELEHEKLLTHPHTSAGRIPTPRGYRYYVDLLMTPQTLTTAEAEAIHALIRQGDDPLEVLETAAQLIADLTGQASAVLAPRMLQSTVRRIELIPMNGRRVLGVVMTNEGVLRHAYLDFPEEIELSELERLSRFLNEELQGHVLSDVESQFERALLDVTSAFNHLYKRAQELWALGGFAEADETLYLEGVAHLLAQPEFHNARQSHRLMAALEAETSVAAVLNETASHGRRCVVIGPENAREELGGCSVVSAPYRAGNRVAGALGVIGPTRLDYPRVAAIVDEAAEAVSQAMARFTL